MKIIDTIANDYEISAYSRFLKRHGMNSAAIFYKNMNEILSLRSCAALRYLMDIAPVPSYEKGQVVFANSKFSIGKVANEHVNCKVKYSGECVIEDMQKFMDLETEDEFEDEIKDIIATNTQTMYGVATSQRFFHLGDHNVIDFDFLLKNGLKGYRAFVLSEMNSTDDPEKIQFEEAMLHMIDATIDYNKRYLCYLQSIKNPDFKLQRLIKALKNVPYKPAANFYEACISIGAGMFFSDCYEPGRMDLFLTPFYENDDSITRDEALYLIRQIFEDIEQRMNHPGTVHVTIGGSLVDGSASYSEVTELCIIAIGGLRAPNVSLRVRDDMPQLLWDAFLENMSHGYAQPAIVNEKHFVQGLVNQHKIPLEDAVNFAFGGCSEVLIGGKSCTDAIWTAYDMLEIFEQTFCNNFVKCDSFESFYNIVKRDILITLNDMFEQTNSRQHSAAVNGTFPYRSLFTTGCIAKGKSFINGGTEYSIDSTNIYGSSNTINSLYTIKKFFEGEFGELSKQDFLKCFMHNYEGFEDVYKKCIDIPKFGNNNGEISEITKDIMTLASEKAKSYIGYRGQCLFIPAIIPWTTWVKFGKRVGATPDGRLAGGPIVDSCGPTQGTDLNGPTSAMLATLDMPINTFVGTAVLNLRLDKNHFVNEQSRTKVQMLLASYFAQGGSQVQINVVDKKTLEDALVNPEKHRDLIVRVGGFSDNFIHLSDDIKKQILLRSEH